MTIASYGDLQTQIANWLARGDLTANIPDFITLFEAYAARKLKVRRSETTTSLTTSSGSVALPSGYIGYRALTWAGSVARQLDYTHPDVFGTLYPSNNTGVPSVFTIIGSNIKVRPYDDTTSLTFDYYAKNAAVSASLDWLFSNYPDAYLFGSLMEAYGFMKDYDQANQWGARRDAIFDEIKLANFRENGPMAMRTVGYTP